MSPGVCVRQSGSILLPARAGRQGVSYSCQVDQSILGQLFVRSVSVIQINNRHTSYRSSLHSGFRPNLDQCWSKQMSNVSFKLVFVNAQFYDYTDKLLTYNVFSTYKSMPMRSFIEIIFCQTDVKSHHLGVGD